MALILKVWPREPLRELFSGVHDVSAMFVIVLRELPMLCSFSYKCAVEPSRGCKTHARLSKKAVTILLSLSNNLSVCGRIFFVYFNQNNVSQQIRCRSRGKNPAFFGFKKFRFSLGRKK